MNQKNNQPRENFHVVSLSGGKDSSCLLLLMIERNLPVDAVLFADTGMEYQGIYNNLKKLDRFLYRNRGLHITILSSQKSFEFLLLNDPKRKPEVLQKRQQAGIPLVGNGWPRYNKRWCTGILKITPIDNEIKRLCQDKNVIQYIGIAADEAQRCTTSKNKRYPLVEWGITEADALKICYEHGFDFDGIYRIFNRASCWCCPMQRIDELRKLYLHYPELWNRLLEMDKRSQEQFGSDPAWRFKGKWSVAGLDERFAQEAKN